MLQIDAVTIVVQKVQIQNRFAIFLKKIIKKYIPCLTHCNIFNFENLQCKKQEIWLTNSTKTIRCSVFYNM